MKGLIFRGFVTLVVLASFFLPGGVHGSSFIRERLRRGYAGPVTLGGYEDSSNRGPPSVPVLYSVPQQQRVEDQNEIQPTTTEFSQDEPQSSQAAGEEGVSEDYQFGGVTQSPSNGNLQDSTGPTFSSSEAAAIPEQVNTQTLAATTYRPSGGYAYEPSRSNSRDQNGGEPEQETVNEILRNNFRHPDQQQVENSQHSFQTATERAQPTSGSGYGNYFQSQQPNFEQISAIHQPTRQQYQEPQQSQGGYDAQPQQQQEYPQRQAQQPHPQQRQYPVRQPEPQYQQQPEQRYQGQQFQQDQEPALPQFSANRAYSTGTEIQVGNSFPSQNSAERRGDSTVVDMDLEGLDENIVDSDLLERVQKIIEDHETQQKEYLKRLRQSTLHQDDSENSSGIGFPDSSIYRGFNENQPQSGASSGEPFFRSSEDENNVSPQDSDEFSQSAFESADFSAGGYGTNSRRTNAHQGGEEQQYSGFFPGRAEGTRAKVLSGNSKLEFQPAILTGHFSESMSEAELRKGRSKDVFRDEQQNQGQSRNGNSGGYFDQNQGSQPRYEAPQAQQRTNTYSSESQQQRTQYLPPNDQERVYEAPHQRPQQFQYQSQEQQQGQPQYQATQEQQNPVTQQQQPRAEVPEQRERVYLPPQAQQERVYLPPRPEVQSAPEQQEREYLPPQPQVQQERVYLPPQQPQGQQERVYLPPQQPQPQQFPEQQERVYLPPQPQAQPPQQQERVYLPPQPQNQDQPRYQAPVPEQQPRVYLPPQQQFQSQPQQRAFSTQPEQQVQPEQRNEQEPQQEQRGGYQIRTDIQSQYQPRPTLIRDRFSTKPTSEPELNKPGYQTFYLTPEQARSSFTIPQPSAPSSFQTAEEETNNIPSGPSQQSFPAQEQVQRYEEPQRQQNFEQQSPAQYNNPFSSLDSQNSFSQPRAYPEPDRPQEVAYLPPQEQETRPNPYQGYQFSGEPNPMIRQMLGNPNVITRTIVIHERPVQSFGASGQSNRAVITAEDLRGESREPESPAYQYGKPQDGHTNAYPQAQEEQSQPQQQYQFLTASAQLSVANPAQETPQRLYNAPYPSEQEQGAYEQGNYGVPNNEVIPTPQSVYGVEGITSPRPIYGIPQGPVLGPESIQQQEPVSDAVVIDAPDQRLNSLQPQPNEYLPPRREESTAGSRREVVSSAPSRSWDPNLFTIYRLPHSEQQQLGYSQGPAQVSSPLVSNTVGLPSHEYQSEDLTTSYGHNVLVRRTLRKRFSPAVISPLAGFFSTNSKSS